MCAVIKPTATKAMVEKLNVWPLAHTLGKQITNWKETDILTLTQTK